MTKFHSQARNIRMMRTARTSALRAMRYHHMDYSAACAYSMLGAMRKRTGRTCRGQGVRAAQLVATATGGYVYGPGSPLFASDASRSQQTPGLRFWHRAL